MTMIIEMIKINAISEYLLACPGGARSTRTTPMIMSSMKANNGK
jgi:hypothetical protein